jgi:tellurite resistance protein
MLLWLALILVAVLLLVVAVGAVPLFLPYVRSPLKSWRDQVLALVAAARRRAEREQAEVQRLRANHAAEAKAHWDKAFLRLLAGISVHELEAYPGIGPGTVGKLHDAGYTNLASLQNARIHISGLGEKRLTDIGNAVRDLSRRSWERLQAGAGPESQDLSGRLQVLERSHQEADRRAQARFQAAKNILGQLEGPAAAARRVTLWNFLWHDADDLVPPEVLAARLPDLETAVRMGDEQARQAHAQQQRTVQAKEVPVPVLPAKPAVAQSVARPERLALPEEPVLRGIPVAAARSAAPGASPPPLSASAGLATPAAAAPPEDRHLLLLDLTIQFACLAARTDGSISQKERGVIEEDLERRYRYDTALHNRARAFLAHYESAAIDREACLRRIADEFAPGLRQALLAFACRIAEASGPMNKRERQFLERVAGQWGVPWTPPEAGPRPAPVQTQAAKAAPPAPPPQASQPCPEVQQRAVLEIDPAAPLSPDLIRRQYHLLVERNDPAKVQARGAKYVALAKSECEAVTAAARVLMERFGEPLENPAEPAPAELRHNPDLDDVFGA